ncbi:Fgenesh protein, partial [Trifolium medium]|nr:Fgenesh protein [Trifolium medium]
TVTPSQSLAIPHYALELFPSQNIRNYRDGLNYLVDVMGVVTHVFCQPADGMSGVMDFGVKVILADMGGSFECLLSGDNAYQLERMLNGCNTDVPILILLFVKIVSKDGFVYVQCIDDVSKVVLNPHYVEVDQFKIDMGYVNCSIPLGKKEYYSSSKS